MKNYSWSLLKQLKTAFRNTPVSLYDLVSQLQVGLSQQAIGKNSVIINEVDKTHSIQVDNDVLAYIVGSILSNAVFSTSDCCIRVDSIRRNDTMELRVRNNGVFKYNSSMSSLVPIADAARKIGGNIGLECEENYSMSVVLSLAATVAA